MVITLCTLNKSLHVRCPAKVHLTQVGFGCSLLNEVVHVALNGQGQPSCLVLVFQDSLKSLLDVFDVGQGLGIGSQSGEIQGIQIMQKQFSALEFEGNLIFLSTE